jgi:hypothetical protein
VSPPVVDHSELAVSAVLHVSDGLVDDGVGDGVADVALAVKGLLINELNENK